MFEQPNQPTPPAAPVPNPLNPVMPAPGMVPPPVPAPMGGMPTQLPPQPQIHTMPDRFRTTGGTPKGSGGNKRLLVILLVLIGVGIVVVGGLWAMQQFLNTNTVNTNTENENSTLNTNDDLNQNTNTDLNSNLNENENGNVNSDLNANTNLNENANGNVNTSLNTNTVSNANTNTSTNTNTPISNYLSLPTSRDGDQDGLTDVEETAYTTDANNPDSDGDTYLDGKVTQSGGKIAGEAYLGFNPKGTGTLEASTIVKRVTNSGNAYSTLIPSTWTASDATNGLLITPSASTGEFFQITVTTNATSLTPTQWYLQQNPSASSASLTTVAVNGLEGVISEDGSTVYLFRGTNVYAIQYATGSVTQVNYRTTFDIIVRNFKLVATS